VSDGRNFRAALALVALSIAASCGYSTKRLVDFGSARSIAVLPFENTGFRRDLELRLTQSVAEEVRARTPLSLAAPDRADLLLEASMGAQEKVLLQDRDRHSLLQRLSGDVDVTLRDRRTGSVVRRYRVSTQADFTPDRFGESLEGSATEEWVRRTAERVVRGLEGAW
jgi:hypothetical protein